MSKRTYPSHDDPSCPYDAPSGLNRRYSQRAQKWYACDPVDGQWIKWLSPEPEIVEIKPITDRRETIIKGLEKQEKVLDPEMLERLLKALEENNNLLKQLIKQDN